MRAALYLVAAVAAALYHLLEGSLLLALGLVLGIACYGFARWYVDRPAADADLRRAPHARVWRRRGRVTAH